MFADDKTSIGEYEAQFWIENEYDEYEPRFRIAAFVPGDGFWATKDGRTLKISEMTDSHLRNAIALHDRIDGFDPEKIDELQEELAHR